MYKVLVYSSLLSHLVWCNPLVNFNAAQSPPKNLLGNNPCGYMNYRTQTYLHTTDPETFVLANGTIIANTFIHPTNPIASPVQRESLLPTAILTSSLAEPTKPEKPECEVVEHVSRINYRGLSLDLGPALLQIQDSPFYFFQIRSSYRAFRFTLEGRLPDTPDVPAAYHPIDDSRGSFSLDRSLWVKISISFSSTEPKTVDCTLYRVSFQ